MIRIERKRADSEKYMQEGRPKKKKGYLYDDIQYQTGASHTPLSSLLLDSSNIVTSLFLFSFIRIFLCGDLAEDVVSYAFVSH